jgi:hypothetical protein
MLCAKIFVAVCEIHILEPINIDIFPAKARNMLEGHGSWAGIKHSDGKLENPNEIKGLFEKMRKLG